MKISTRHHFYHNNKAKIRLQPESYKHCAIIILYTCNSAGIKIKTTFSATIEQSQQGRMCIATKAITRQSTSARSNVYSKDITKMGNDLSGGRMFIAMPE